MEAKLEFSLTGRTGKKVVMSYPSEEEIDKLIEKTPARDKDGGILNGIIEKGYVGFYEKEFTNFFKKHLKPESEATVQDIMDHLSKDRNAIEQFRIANIIISQIKEGYFKVLEQSFRFS